MNTGPAVVSLTLAALAPGLAGAADLAVSDPRCEYRVNPLGIDTPQPRLAWKLVSDVRGQRQAAYQVLVASSAERLARDEADLWDTGRVASEQSIQVVYRGKPLASGQRCFWKVRAWPARGAGQDVPSPWSKPAWWEMGLLAEADWKGAWIGDGRPIPERDEDFYLEDPAPLFRREFGVSGTVAKARLYITGLGYYEASLNGMRVGDFVLDPGWTHYAKRILYSTYDVTGALKPGPNCLGVTLGNGWYNPLPLRMWGGRNIRTALPTGRPVFRARLEIVYADGRAESVVSDGRWKHHPGPVLRNNIYLGEVYDARRELPGWDRPGFDDAGWANAAEAPGPGGRLQAQFQPPIRQTAVVKPVRATAPKPGVFLYDLGQNFSGLVRFRVEAAAGTRIRLRYGELLNADGTLNPMTSVCGQIKGRRKDGTPVGGPGAPEIAWQEDTYIAKGGGPETYVPRFTWHAFRYVEVTGCGVQPPLDALEGLRIHSDVESAGTFACSNERLNRIQTMVDWTFRSNLIGVQSDCPHRERFGYGGDLVVTCDAFLLNYDMASFYAKSARDGSDAAREDGMFTDTAPFVGIQYCGVGWAMAYPLLLAELYRYYGDRRLVEEEYAAASKWLGLVRAQNPDHLVKKGLSDHEGLAPAPAPAMVTPLYYQSARILARLAAILGRQDEASRYEALAREIKAACRARFLQKETGIYGPGTQAGQAFALYAGLVDAEERQAALEVLVSDILEKQGGRLSTGIFGTKYMLDVLSLLGRADIAYAVVDRPDYPGWGHMLEQGATTLWEHWAFSDNTYSHNHPMFGSVSEWFFKHVAGIAVDADAAGADRLTIHPKRIDALDWAKATYRSIRGPVASGWRRGPDGFHLDVAVPVGASATVGVPAAGPDDVTEGGGPAREAEGVSLLRVEDGTVFFRVEAGTYRFVSKEKGKAKEADPPAGT